jgi:diguanylate cyclase (GGDEF)-like protein
MAVSGSRAPWLVALLVALLALPIVGITAYFTIGIQKQIAKVEDERAGLARLDQLDAFFVDASTFALASQCPVYSDQAATAGTRADASSSKIGDPQVQSAWSDMRIHPQSKSATDRLFQALTAAYVTLSDQSGLTFDPSTSGIDISDSRAYRAPVALDQLQQARRTLCSISDPMKMVDRISLIRNQTRADQSNADNFLDIRDMLKRNDPNLHLKDIAAALSRAEHAADAASARLNAFVGASTVPPDRDATARALDELISSLYALSQAEPPVMGETLDQRLVEYGHQRLITIVPGIIGILAAVIIAFLTMRLVWERAANEIALRAAAEHERIANHDGLTGLLNRRAFLGALGIEVKEPHLGALCIFDIDDFKGVNDTYGHLAGDAVLVRFARLLEASVRSTDAVSRLGGDEFALFLHKPIDRRGVERILTAITTEAAAPFEIRGQIVRASVSVGAAMIDKGLVRIEDALAAADAALYRAKATNHGSFLFADRSQAAS